MNIHFQASKAADWKSNCALLFFFEGTMTPELLEELAPNIAIQGPWLTISPALQDAKNKKDQISLLYGHPNFNIPRVLFAGLGKIEDFTLQTLKLAMAAAVQRCKNLELSDVLIDCEHIELLCDYIQKNNPAIIVPAVTEICKELCLAAQLSLYSYDKKGDYACKTTEKTKKKDIESKDEKNKDEENKIVALETIHFCSTKKYFPDGIKQAIRLGEAVAQGIIVARNLANAPANIVTPRFITAQAEKLAKEVPNMSCKVLSFDECKTLGMGCFCSVATGSIEPAQFIILEYTPKGTEQDNPIVLIGKGITFDTGGISLKPAAKMHEMKADMAGAAAVFGTLNALAEGNIVARVVALLPCTENMPDGLATKPGDVVSTLSGKTVEIINTDAEGRLVLCDALTYAQNNYTPHCIIDIATLTGACVVALGTEIAGVFSNKDTFAQKLCKRAQELDEPMWHLPLWASYNKALESPVADLQNVGPREGGTINAALFLQNFVEKDMLWAHIDIAGTAFTSAKSALCPSGATGFGVRTLFDIVCNQDLLKN